MTTCNCHSAQHLLRVISERDEARKERDMLKQDLASMKTSWGEACKERDEAKTYATRLRGAINGMGPQDLDYMYAMEAEVKRLQPENAALRAFLATIASDMPEGESDHALVVINREELRLATEQWADRAANQINDSYNAAVESGKLPEVP